MIRTQQAASGDWVAIDDGLAGKVSGKRIGEVLDEELANGGRQR